ncbi:MAG: AraC family transcriptional regulator [Chitinophagaceae bacterium]|jgi:AraC-like DNA-binding protein
MKIQSPYLSPVPKFEEKKIIIADTPSYAFGVGSVQHTRIFMFEILPSKFYIDFISQDLTEGAMFIIPPMHFHFLHPVEKSRFICIDVHDSLFNNKEKQLIYALKYLSHKTLKSNSEDNIPFNILLELCNSGYDAQNNYNHFIHCISSYMDLDGLYKNTNRQCMQIVDSYLNFLGSNDLKLDNFSVDKIAIAIGCSERTLHRACITVFGISPQNISKYHIILKGIFLLSRHNLPISSIAENLGFSTLSAFDKCVKRVTKLTPKKIRETLFEIGL